MYKKISKILLCALILVLAVGAVSAMENATADDAVASDATDDVMTVSDDEIDQATVEEPEDDVIGACEEESVGISEDGDAVGVSEDEKIISSEDGEHTLKASLSESKLSSTDDGSSVQYKIFAIGKNKIPKKYLSKKYKDSPKVKKIMEKKIKAMEKKAKKKLIKIMKKGWKNYQNQEPVVTKTGKYYIITYSMAFYRSA